MLMLLVTTLIATTLVSSQDKEDPTPLEQVILTGAADNSTGEEDTASEDLLTDLREQEWMGDAVKDIAYYLRAHKFNDFDRRWFTRADDATTKLYSKFPDPALRTLHWEVKKHCMPDFISCVQYLQEKILQAELVRKDDTVTVMVDQGWTLPHNQTQVDLVDQDCQKLYRLDWVGAQPFLGPLEKFQWRTSASYFMCWYTMQEIPVLAMFQEACDNFASCLDPWYGPFNHDPRADDRLPYQCAIYSFCPDPCCPEKYYDSLDKCWDSQETNPCYQEAPEGDRTCTLERRDNTDLLNIILNMWNVSCACKLKGFEWSSRYGMCVDINECTQGLHSCNPESESCSNTPGGYDCLCRWGYLYNQSEERCIQNELLMAAEAGQIDVPAYKQDPVLKIILNHIVPSAVQETEFYINLFQSGGGQFISSICLQSLSVLFVQLIKHS